jgi:hypothetical protein
VEQDNPTRDVPNPALATIDGKLREARAELSRLQAKYGFEALVNPEGERLTMRGFKIALSILGGTIWSAMKRVTDLEAKRATMPKRVLVQEVVTGKVVKVAPEWKHLTNLLKVVAHQVERSRQACGPALLPTCGGRRPHTHPIRTREGG